MMPPNAGDFQHFGTPPTAAPASADSEPGIDIIAIIKALYAAKGTLLQRLASPKVAALLIGAIPSIVIAIQAIRQQLPAQWGAVAAAAAAFLGAVFVAATAYENAQTSQAAADVVRAHLNAQSIVASARIAAARQQGG